MTKSKETGQENFEKSLSKLQSIVKELESGECTLEDSIKKFEEGMLLAKACQKKLSAAEAKVELLMKASDEGVETKPFDLDEE
ncbi:MAG: exodeoxyribonuclease VII small subunit [Oligoflexia bacterium]|nr:exodeoxyribonuclease VII small subunit [Oligoflexia bacterium]